MTKQDDDRNQTGGNAELSADDDTESNDSGSVDEDDLVPADVKRGEQPDNLRRRSDWFQKRSGRR